MNDTSLETQTIPRLIDLNGIPERLAILNSSNESIVTEAQLTLRREQFEKSFLLQESNIAHSQRMEILEYFKSVKEQKYLQEKEERKLEQVLLDQESKRNQAFVIYVTGSVILISIFFACILIISNHRNSDDDKIWARNTMTHLTLGLTTFFIGKKTGNVVEKVRQDQQNT